MPRITVGFTTSPRRIARSSVSRRKPSTRDQSPTYGDGGHCACIPASRSIAGRHADPFPFEEQLPRERRAVQLPQRQDSFHATRLNETDAPVTTAKCARPSSDLPTAPGLT